MCQGDFKCRYPAKILKYQCEPDSVEVMKTTESEKKWKMKPKGYIGRNI